MSAWLAFGAGVAVTIAAAVLLVLWTGGDDADHEPMLFQDTEPSR